MAAKKKSVSAKKGRQTAEQRHAREQLTALLLLVGAILCTALLLYEGKSLWGWIHNLIFGLFGLCSFLLPPIMVYLAVALAKGNGSIAGKLWQTGLLTAVVSSTLHIFNADTAVGYFKTLGRAYTDGTHWKGGGFFGAILGDLMERLFTDLGAKIILILVLFVFVMLVTGTSVLTVLGVVSKPAKKTKEKLTEAAKTMKEKAVVARAEKEKEKDKKIDVDMGAGYV
ncbi:MAG: DNA translocase FtsK 4TM domain-containing protein, partial [Clostridia bacterium]|nr:DNA translocase FtsK 4TM domain-containing protein [Clostridia bacterium]